MAWERWHQRHEELSRFTWSRLSAASEVRTSELTTEVRESGLSLAEWSRSKRQQTVSATPAGLHVEGKLRIPRDVVAGASYEVGGDTPLLRVTDVKGKTIEIVVSGFVEATAVFAALSVTPRATFTAAWSAVARPKRTSRAVAQSAFGLLASALGLLLPFFVPMRGRFGAALAIIVGAGLAWTCWTFAFRRKTVAIGADGLVLSQMGRRSRFVPYDDVRDISVATFAPARKVLRVTLRDASLVTLNTRELATLLLRLRAAIEVHRRHGAAADVGARIRKGGRSDQAWIADIAAMRNGGSEYRAGALPDDDLWGIIENPAASEDARAAAAALLRERGTDAKTRIRVVAEATVSPKLRIALEAASSNEERRDEDILGGFECHADAASQMHATR